MQWSLVHTAPPLTEPVSLAEMKLHCRIDIADEDALLTGLISAARTHLERLTGRSFCTTSWRYSQDRWPCADGRYSPRGAILMPRPPLLSVTTVAYTSAAGVYTILPSADYEVDADSEPARIGPAYGKTWPTIRPSLGAVQVEYQAGYGAADDVPTPLKQAIKMLAAHWYEHREAVDVGAWGELPMAVQSLAWSYWTGSYLIDPN